MNIIELDYISEVQIRKNINKNGLLAPFLLMLEQKKQNSSKKIKITFPLSFQTKHSPIPLTK